MIYFNIVPDTIFLWTYWRRLHFTTSLLIYIAFHLKLPETDTRSNETKMHFFVRTSEFEILLRLPHTVKWYWPLWDSCRYFLIWKIGKCHNGRVFIAVWGYYVYKKIERTRRLYPNDLLGCSDMRKTVCGNTVIWWVRKWVCFGICGWSWQCFMI